MNNKSRLPFYSLICIISIWLSLKAQAQWEQQANFPGGARAYTTSFSIGPYGYVGLGQFPPNGQFFSDFWRFDPQENNWTQMASLSTTLSRATAQGFNGKAYCGTGYNGSARVNSWYEYDPASDSWTAKAPVPGGPREYAISFVLSNKIYVGGGTPNQPLLDDLHAYDPATNTWTQVANLPSPRIFASCFTANGKAYLFGGFVGPGQYANATVHEYDPVLDSWTEKSQFPGQARSHLNSFSLNGKGYLGFGQHNTGAVYFNDWFEYDPDANSWTNLGSFPGGQRRFGASVQIGDQGFVCTGLQGTTVFLSDTWTFASGGTTSMQKRKAGEAKVHLFPNPATEKVIIRMEDSGHSTEAKLVDNLGRECWKGQIQSQEELFLSTFPNGLYRLVFQANGKVFSENLLIQR